MVEPVVTATSPFTANAHAASTLSAPALESEVNPVEPSDAAHDKQRPSHEEQSLTETARKLIEKLDTAARKTNSRLRIQVNDEIKTYVYQLVHRETGEVLRQWPPEEVVRMLQFLNEVGGLIVDEEV